MVGLLNPHHVLETGRFFTKGHGKDKHPVVKESVFWESIFQKEKKKSAILYLKFIAFQFNFVFKSQFFLPTQGSELHLHRVVS